MLGDYPDKVYPVNPQGGEILDLRVFKELEDIDEPIDLAYIVILISKDKRRTYEPIIKIRQVIRKETKNVSRKLDCCMDVVHSRQVQSLIQMKKMN